MTKILFSPPLKDKTPADFDLRGFFHLQENGGAKRDRTADLNTASEIITRIPVNNSEH